MAGIPPPSRSAAREAVIAAEAAAKSAKSKGKKKARPGANAKMPCVLNSLLVNLVDQLWGWL